MLRSRRGGVGTSGARGIEHIYQVNLCGCTIHAFDGSSGRRFVLHLWAGLFQLFLRFVLFVCLGGAVAVITIPQVIFAFIQDLLLYLCSTNVWS